jgi:hypothetical protein
MPLSAALGPIEDIGAAFVLKDGAGVGTDTERFSEMTF